MKNPSKYIFAFLLMLFCIWPWPHSVANSTTGIKWFSYDEGMLLGKRENKKIFLYFYTNWCPYCGKMAKETFTDPMVASSLNEHFIPIRVNSDIEQKIAARYLVRGVPVIWLLQEDGKKIGVLPGFIPPARLLKILQKVQPPSTPS